MARANRTAELLAAARLVDLELGREAEKTRRQSAQSQALASLIPELVQAGTSIAGKVNDYDLAQKKQAADIDYRASLAGLAERKVDLAEKKQTEPKPVTPFAKEKEDRAAAEEARRQARFDEEQMKKSEGREQDRLSALMNSSVDNDLSGRGRGVSLDELKASAEKTGVAPGAMLERIDTETLKDANAAKKMEMSQIEMDRRKARDAQIALNEEASRKEREAARLAKENEKKLGKPLPAEISKERALKISALNLADRLKKAKKIANGTGSVQGRIENFLGAVKDDPKWSQFRVYDQAFQRVVGRVLEGGKLAEGDAKTYREFLNDPERLDDKEYDAVVNSMIWFLDNDLDTFDASFQGYHLAPRPPRDPEAADLVGGEKTTTADQDAAEVPGVVIEGP